MLFEANGKRPQIDASAVIAPTAVISGDVIIGPNVVVSFGVVILGDDGPVRIGEQAIVREHVVIRGTQRHAVEVGRYVLIGARSALYGCQIDDEAFLATGVTVFHGARVGARAEIRINGVVHVNTYLSAGAMVPIGWVAVGDPAQVHAPADHEAIWSVQQSLDFPRTAYGIDRGPDGNMAMREVTGGAVRAARACHWKVIP